MSFEFIILISVLAVIYHKMIKTKDIEEPDKFIEVTNDFDHLQNRVEMPHTDAFLNLVDNKYTAVMYIPNGKVYNEEEHLQIIKIIHQKPEWINPINN